MSGTEESGRLRIDKWLWYARFFKSRTLATEAVSSGKVRVNRQPVRKPGHSVQPGDVLTFQQVRLVRVIEVVALGARRGPASEAQGLYRDLDPPRRGPPAHEPAAAVRPRGSGRPTKKQRRATDALQH